MASHKFSSILIEKQMATRSNTRNTNKTRKQAGGKRTLSPALREWNKRVMTLYREMKKKNPKTKLMDAMRAAKKQKGTRKH